MNEKIKKDTIVSSSLSDSIETSMLLILSAYNSAESGERLSGKDKARLSFIIKKSEILIMESEI